VEVKIFLIWAFHPGVRDILLINIQSVSHSHQPLILKKASISGFQENKQFLS